MTLSIFVNINKPMTVFIKQNISCKNCCGLIENNQTLFTSNTSNCNRIQNPNKNKYIYKNKYTKKLYIPCCFIKLISCDVKIPDSVTVILSFGISFNRLSVV